MSSAHRVIEYREKQKRAGRKLVSLYLSEDTIEILKLAERPRPISRGEIVERAVKAFIDGGSARADE